MVLSQFSQSEKGRDPPLAYSPVRQISKFLCTAPIQKKIRAACEMWGEKKKKQKKKQQFVNYKFCFTYITLKNVQKTR